MRGSDCYNISYHKTQNERQPIKCGTVDPYSKL